MKKIRVRKRLEVYALIDDEDESIVSKYTWCWRKDRGYAVAIKKGANLFLHRLIMNVIDKKVMVDHIDGNPLNNQKSNLRLCNANQNNANRRPNRNGSSKFLGVSISKFYRKYGIGTYRYYIAQATSNKKKHFAGRFPFTPDGEIQAAKAYDELAKNLHGEFANLNFKQTNEKPQRDDAGGD